MSKSTVRLTIAGVDDQAHLDEIVAAVRGTYPSDVTVEVLKESIE